MNYNVLYDIDEAKTELKSKVQYLAYDKSSKEDVIECCRSLDNCNASLSVICNTQQKMIKDLSKVVRGFNDIIKAEHEFDMSVRRLQRIENKMLDAYDNSCRPKATSDNQDVITFKKVNDPPQGQKIDADTPSLSDVLEATAAADKTEN